MQQRNRADDFNSLLNASYVHPNVQPRALAHLKHEVPVDNRFEAASGRVHGVAARDEIDGSVCAGFVCRKTDAGVSAFIGYGDFHSGHGSAGSVCHIADDGGAFYLCDGEVTVTKTSNKATMPNLGI